MKAIVIGATGLIGKELVRQLLDNSGYDEVAVLVRKSTGITHPKLREHVINFDDPQTYKELLKGDVLFCAMGTTIKKAGSQDAFRKIDYQFVVDFASTAARNGVKQFCVVSSVRAKTGTSNFYLRTKGEMESAVSKLGFDAVHIFRPSLLLGNRGESRPGEKIGEFFFKVFGFLFFGSLKRYKPVQGSAVAKAMIDATLAGKHGINIVESEMIGG
ncbi:MAG: NAD(P)H-binding protein [Ignavibacteria bacterium]|nr:NAD(P)H-binding protein [Ignavibacteria bacterium]